MERWLLFPGSDDWMANPEPHYSNTPILPCSINPYPNAPKLNQSVTPPHTAYFIVSANAWNNSAVEVAPGS